MSDTEEPIVRRRSEPVSSGEWLLAGLAIVALVGGVLFEWYRVSGRLADASDASVGIHGQVGGVELPVTSVTVNATGGTGRFDTSTSVAFVSSLTSSVTSSVPPSTNTVLPAAGS